MTLTAGSRLGPYEVLSSISATDASALQLQSTHQGDPPADGSCGFSRAARSARFLRLKASLVCQELSSRVSAPGLLRGGV